MRIIKAMLIMFSFVFVLASCDKESTTNVSRNISSNDSKIKNSDLNINNKKKNDLGDNIKKENNTDESNKIIENKKTPIAKIDYMLKNNTIVIDPGHATKGDLSMEPIGPGDTKQKYKQTGGAFGYKTRIPEYKVNMQVAKKLKKYLTEKGYNVLMTKKSNDKVMANSDRAKVGNESNAGLVIRIHADSSTNHKAEGASMLIPANNKYCENFYEESKAFGEVILNTVTKEVGMKNRGLIERTDISGFNWSSVPVILIEIGFLSNEKEEILLSSESYQDKIANTIVKGLEAIEIDNAYKGYDNISKKIKY